VRLKQPGQRAVACLAAALSVTVLSSCGAPEAGDSRPSAVPGATSESGGIVAQVASYQLVAHHRTRLLVALLSNDNRWLSFGSVPMSFTFLGDGTASPAPGIQMPPKSATFLPIPGTPEGTDLQPTLTDPADGRGLYGLESVTFPEAGYWQVTARGTTADGTPFTADAAFQVIAAPTIREPGDRALASDNAIIGTPGIPKVALDSRAATGGRIPDPELHRISIADAMRAHEPALVVFSTPVYCVSRFCGPITDLVAELSHEYADRAAFIHVEIYRDFQANELNQAASDWLQTPSGDLREPWVFLIGADGIIRGSWDTMVTRDELESALRRLPKRN
jgi:hypothetical protein